ncbi:alpha-1,2-mannosyltransferase [Rhizoctonia solani AG-1 IB]|uniref:Mannosyltransferase n=1 Tax=Thanatephorus cucumeris (strain AG1-IB / isolate 7/3/14) TaxID=1108050 RepID=M5C169_THACB|nr:alpha-1,2-mannosyltransferase [Rhizoctonia solani AG-1 IB]
MVMPMCYTKAINGLDDLRSWTLGEQRIQDHVDVYLSEATMNDVKRGFPYLISKEFATGSGHIPQFKWHIIENNRPLRLDGIEFDITPINVYHGNLPMPQNSSASNPNLAPIPEPMGNYCKEGSAPVSLLFYCRDESAAWNGRHTPSETDECDRDPGRCEEIETHWLTPRPAPELELHGVPVYPPPFVCLCSFEYALRLGPIFRIVMKTWETSPTYALRSWAYVLLHLFPAKFPIWLASFDKRHTFFALRMVFAFVTSFCEARLFTTVVEHVNDRVGRYMLFMLMFNAGMWNASTAFLPSTFAMYAVTAAASFAFAPPSSSRVHRTFAATLLFAAGAIVGWPFSLLLAVPFVVEELTVYGGDIVPESSLPKWIENRWKYLFGSGAVAASLFIPVALIDTYAYGRLTLTPWNIIRYNIFGSSSGRGPNLYGTEPWYYYIFNLVLNFNILAPLALGSLPALLVTRTFDSKRLGGSRGPANQTSSPYTLLAVRLAPFYLWFITLTLQAHKEERFLYPVYPLVCFNAAVTLYLMRGWMETAYVKATKSPYRAANTNLFQLATLFTVVLTCLLSISRAVALFKYYHAPLDVAFHFQYEELPRLLNTTGLLPVPDLTTKKHSSKYDEDAPVDLALVRQFGLRVCWGAEWYRFPGSYLVPSGVEPLLVESGFDGMLPRPFPPVVPITDPSPITKSSSESTKVPLKPSPGLFGELSHTLGRTTRLVPTGFNDLNRAEEGQAADPTECDYFVHLRLPHSPERQEVVPRVGEWEDVACFPFLDAQRSSILSRVFWAPGSLWQKGNTFGEYCLLREKQRAQIRERETKWSKTA